MRTCDSASKLQQKHLVTEPWTFTHKLWAQNSGLYYNYMKYVTFFMSFLYLNKILSEICSKLFKDHLVHIVHKNGKL